MFCCLLMLHFGSIDFTCFTMPRRPISLMQTFIGFYYFYCIVFPTILELNMQYHKSNIMISLLPLLLILLLLQMSLSRHIVLTSYSMQSTLWALRESVLQVQNRWSAGRTCHILCACTPASACAPFGFGFHLISTVKNTLVSRALDIDIGYGTHRHYLSGKYLNIRALKALHCHGPKKVDWQESLLYVYAWRT